MRNNIVAVTAAEAEAAGRAGLDAGEDIASVCGRVMASARSGFLAPDENEAFAASVGALCALYPERKDSLLAEARVIGEKVRLLEAISNGIPVDFGRVDIPKPPEDALGLLDLWHETEVTPA